MANLYPPTIIFGSERPDIRLRARGGDQIYFCNKNRNLHLSDDDTPGGTYEAGRLLQSFCDEFCAPGRSIEEPCPAFVSVYKVFTKDKTLASVEKRPLPELTRCVGVEKLLAMTETPEERYFLQTYLTLRVVDEAKWRSEIVSDWNARCQAIADDFMQTRREKFDSLMWRTLRFPALIPQVWLNWLAHASEEHLRVLDDNPSRVDFMAFHNGVRHLVEIDGPSHYAAYDETTHSYAVDEREYARNLRIARSLERGGWRLTRIGRAEVREAMPGAEPSEEFGAFASNYRLVSIVPFPSRNAYPPRTSYEELGVGELVDPIPF